MALGLDLADTAKIIMQQGGRASAWKAATAAMILGISIAELVALLLHPASVVWVLSSATMSGWKRKVGGSTRLLTIRSHSDQGSPKESILASASQR
jgi:hypothetical protein